MVRKRKRKRPPAIQANLPPLLREPFFIGDYPDETAMLLAWTDRVNALYKRFQIDRSDCNADRLLARALIFGLVPGFRIRIRKPRAKGGRPPFEVDRALLIASIDRWIDVQPKSELKKCTAACRALTRKNQPYNRQPTKALADQFYKHAASTRQTPAYFSHYPERFCANRKTAPCFTLKQFEEADFDELSSLCKRKVDCPFLTSVNQQIESLAVQIKNSSDIRTIGPALEVLRAINAQAQQLRGRALDNRPATARKRRRK